MEKLERYETCVVTHRKIMNLMAFRSTQINRLTGVDSDELMLIFNEDYNDLIKEVEKRF